MIDIIAIIMLNIHVPFNFCQIKYVWDIVSTSQKLENLTCRCNEKYFINMQVLLEIL